MASSHSKDIKKWRDAWERTSHIFEGTPSPIQKSQSLDATKDLNPPKVLAEDKGETKGDKSHREFYELAQQIDKIFKPQGLKEGITKPEQVADNLDRKFEVNPIHFASKGNDQELRVTPNFTDGDIIRELNDIKIKLEALEREVHSAFINDQDAQEKKLQKQLDNLRNKFEELSDKLTPHPIEDVT